MAYNPAAGRMARAIKARRLEQGLTQEALAEALGVDHNTVSRWELGRRSPHRYLDRLAEVLDTTTDALMGGDQ